jgi:hypothetical protein
MTASSLGIARHREIKGFGTVAKVVSSIHSDRLKTRRGLAIVAVRPHQAGDTEECLTTI